MGNLFRLGASAFAGALLAMLFEPFWSGMLLGIGINTAELAPPVIGAIRWAVMQWWLYPAAMIAVGIAIGAWLDVLARRHDRKPIEKAKEIASGDMALLTGVLGGYVRAIDDGEWDALADEKPTGTRLMDIQARLRTVDVSMQKVGVHIPFYFDTEHDPVRFMRDNYEFLCFIHPLLMAGHLKEAQKIGRHVTKVTSSQSQSPLGKPA